MWDLILVGWLDRKLIGMEIAEYKGVLERECGVAGLDERFVVIRGELVLHLDLSSKLSILL